MTTTVEHLRARAPDLSVGLLAGDPLRLSAALDVLDSAGVEVVHIDVMDGVFCPQLVGGAAIVEALPSRYIKDVHLMIDAPLCSLPAYVDAGASILTFHIESTRHPHRCLQSLAGSGVIRGVALNPGTPVESVEPLLDDLEYVLVLGVNPGWGGQAFIPATERRLHKARAIIDGRPIVLGVDGGVTADNVGAIASMGADLIVTGSAIFAGPDPVAIARGMRELARHETADVAHDGVA